MSRRLSALGLLSEIDGNMLSLYCDAYARWVVGSRGLQKHGLLTKASKKGGVVRSPYATLVNQALAQMVRISAEFGLSPSSRARIQTSKEDAGSTAENEFFSRLRS